MKHGSFFSGMGGFDLAAQWMRWENVFHCELNPFGQRILKYYWPNAISYGDITKTDFTIHRGTIDILSGGFPCQPYSVAGKRKGKEDERHLWPEMLRAIWEIQPRWVVGENVRGLTNWNGGVVFDEVQADLETQGYEVLPFLLPACAVNAPHRRDRIWFVAWNTNSRISSGDRAESEVSRSQQGTNPLGICNLNASNSQSIGLQQPRTSRDWWEGSENDSSNYVNPYTNHQRLQGSENNGNTDSPEQNRTEQPTGFFPPTWEEFPTVSPLRNGDDGFPTQLDGITVSKHRAESIKAGGNAIVPQVAYQIFKAIEQYEKQCATGS